MGWIIASVCLLLTVWGILEGCFRLAVHRSGLPLPKRKSSKPRPWAVYQKDIEAGQAWIAAQPTQEVSIQSHDGLTLKGLFIPRQAAARTVLCMHGYRSPALRDFAPVVRYYHEHGCNVLLAHQRAHGASQGRHICYGAKERYDCLRWAQYLTDRLGPAHSIFLDGISMGGATVLMASALPLPPTVRGIIADCGFSSPREIIAHVMRRDFHLPKYPLLPVFMLYCRLRAGFDPSVNTVDAVKQAKVPIILLHGTQDDLVPCYMSERAYAACAAPKQLYLVPGAGHGLSYMVDRPGVEAAIQKFLDEYT